MAIHFIRQSSLIIALTLASAGCAIFFESPGTALAQAAERGDIAQIKALIVAGADPNQYDASGQTALHWAARGGHPIGPHRCRGEGAERAAVVATLIELGARPNLVDRRATIPGGASGWTALHIALHHEQFQSAAVLLKAGADPNIRSQQGTSVMSMAADEGAPRDLLDLLIEKGFDAQKAESPTRR